MANNQAAEWLNPKSFEPALWAFWIAFDRCDWLNGIVLQPLLDTLLYLERNRHIVRYRLAPRPAA